MSKAGTPDLAISIGTLGNFGMLERCLRSIFIEDAPNLRYQVWVVFNGAHDDGTTDRIRREFPQVTVLAEKGPLGYCGTHNLVLKRRPGRYVLVLDDDTIVHAGTLSTMVAFMDVNQDVGIAGCKTLNPDGTYQKSYGLLPGLKTELVNAFRPAGFWPRRLYKDTAAVKEVEWLNGSFMLVRSEVLERVGILDEQYYTYVCESDWCYRIHRAGWKVAYVPHATIIHVGGQHSLNTTFRADNEIVRAHVNRFYFVHKHYGRTQLFLLRPLVMLGALVRISYFLPLYIFHRASRQLAAARIKGFVRVLQVSLSRKPYCLPAGMQKSAG
jgi:GT2 family glycosyltransferase